MSDIFLKLVEMSIAASWLVLATVLVRLLLKKAPRSVICILWALVAFRLLCPVTVKSSLSLVPEAKPAVISAAERVLSTGSVSVQQERPRFSEPVSAGALLSATGAKSVHTVDILAIIWLAGVGAMLLYALISFIRVKIKVREAVREDKRVYRCAGITTPFILGVFFPKIYIPYGLDGKHERLVLSHEAAHISRRDHLWKPLGFLLLSVYWFNPAIWAAYILLCRDIELACDEKVIKKLGTDERADYSEALLICSAQRRMTAACPLAFGEVGVKTRIKSVLNYRKPAFWIIAAAIVACAVLAVCFLTNPKDKDERIKLAPTRLSTDYLVEVSENENLSWSDFEDFEHSIYEDGETVMWEFYIDELYRFWIGGESTDTEPWNMELDCLNHGGIDIREADVAAFLDENYSHYDFAQAGLIERMGSIGPSDIKYVTNETISAEKAAEIIGNACGDLCDNSAPLEWELWSIDVYLSGGPDTFSSDKDEYFTFIAGLTENKVDVFYSKDGKRTNARFENEELYWLVRTCYDSEPGIDTGAYAKYGQFIEDRAAEIVENSKMATGAAAYTGYEITGFRLFDSFSSGGADYEVYRWDAAFLTDDIRKVPLAGGMLVDSELRIRGCDVNIYFAIRIANGVPGDAVFLGWDIYNGENEAKQLENGRSAVVSAISGEPLLNEAVLPAGELYVAFTPTDSAEAGMYQYVLLPNETAVRDMLEPVKKYAVTGEYWLEGESQSGVWIVDGDEWWSFTDEGALIGLRSGRIHALYCKELFELCSFLAKEAGMGEVVRPAQIKNIAKAELLFDESITVTDRETLAEIESLLSGSREIIGGAGCWFTAPLTLTLTDGTTVHINMATDGCPVWMSEGVCYRYGLDSNEDFFALFGVNFESVESAG